ncbi:MAG: hypothetical protein K0S05_3359 [Agromyces sp.]|nr:hypothetical protein [Agromyces sp.]
MHLEGQLDREAVGVVQEERGVARQLVAPRLLRGGDRRVEDGRAGGERAQERLLLAEGELLDVRVVVRDFGVRRLHGVTRGREQLPERRPVDAEEAHRPDGATQESAEDVPAALVRRRDAVAHEHERGTHVVGDDAHAHVVVVIRPVGASRQLGGTVEHRAHLVDLVHVLDALLDEGDALEPHPGVDVLLRQLAHDAEVGLRRHVVDEVLHEHEVPDLDVPVVVGGRATVDAVGRSAVEEDLGAGTGRARLARVPVVRVLAEALDALVGKARDLLPQLDGLVVVLVDGDPEVVRIEAESTA